ncbi:phosphonate ABC transporter substrate-binding protein [Nodularia spumigena CS-584]|uniref:Phosphate-import protein PhnD n=3 Tax=Nodularia spumigena TaxID=70799 RepID=A0A2S0Q5R4_NODSP|nr:phosphonate ABC transporter substrate-binding protein [Nodularia spumigena]AHJ27096.1 Phosphonate ABC transporter phosphate-binding periplasmic component [Nodularia spumigena CCY9414]AVZ29672.1 phosphate-import protein PhnD [Nodularia spumigena UHCC 0039]EAW47336.1 Phosphonate-binding periplasmic protein [Nodularia spumigena CCY9414]KZL48485.1 phosphonate ABC transporter substrate-binding protein [Nodularia spumigena CENA596]MDB9382965.1 phosphonate ABC transporter substrate-binding protein
MVVSRRNPLLLGIAVVLIGAISSCALLNSNSQKENLADNDKEIVLGLIPAESNEEVVAQFEPMRAYMEKKIGRPITMFTATDYAGIVEAMRRGRVDIAWFGALSYIMAEQEAGAEAFAVGVPESGDSTYNGIMMVPADSDIQSIKDLEGKNVAFVDPASTSGGLVPSFMVKQTFNRDPQEVFGRLTYAGSHDAAMLAVRNKSVDAAASHTVIYQTMIDRGLITEQTNRIIAKSAPIPGPPLTYRRDLDDKLKTQIRETILNAHNDIDVTGFGKLARYEVATPDDYNPIREMIKTLGLKREEILK